MSASFVYHPDNYGNLVKNGPQSRQPLTSRMCIGVRPGGNKIDFGAFDQQTSEGGVKYRIFHSWLLYTILSFWISSSDVALKTYRPNLQFPIVPNNPSPFDMVGAVSGCECIVESVDCQSCLTCFEKTAISSLNDSELHTSPPATPGSRGVQVASSHFSNMSASRGNRGCLKLEIC